MALVLVVRARGARCRSTASRADWLAVAFGAFVVALRAASRRAGSAAARRTRACSTALRHDLLPVGAYFLGRGLDLTRERAARGSSARSCSRPRRRRGVRAGRRLRDPARSGGATRARPAGSATSSASTTSGLSGLPENFVYNTGNERRLPAARLDVPVAARDVVPARRRAALRCGCSRRRAGMLVLWPLLRCFAGAAVDALALVVPRARGRPRRARDRRGARCGLGSSAAVVAVLGVALRQGLRHIGAARRLHAGRARPSRSEREARSRRVARSDGRRRVVEHREPLAEPARRRADGRPPPVGLRARQRGRHGGAHAHEDRRQASPRTRSSASRLGLLGGLVFVAWSLALCAAWRSCVGVARRGVRRRARPRVADGRDRRSMDRRHRLGARRRRCLAESPSRGE